MPDPFINGIDVSSNQPLVDWGAVAAAGNAFTFARATIGGHQVDSKFSTHWQGIKNAGMVRGAYHFFWPLTPWRDQAENFIKTVGSLTVGDLPPVLDLEEAIAKSDPRKLDNWGKVPWQQRLPLIENWLDKVGQAFGMRPIIYTRQNFIDHVLGDGVQKLGTSALWIAHYDVDQPSIPPGWDTWTFWQYSETGTVDGLDGNVDCDRFNGSQDDLQALTKS